ncbi:hypothetical protein M011DRAFT_464044, partial [Sporormia fimetaria CBS 119925]
MSLVHYLAPTTVTVAVLFTGFALHFRASLTTMYVPIFGTLRPDSDDDWNGSFIAGAANGDVRAL